MPRFETAGHESRRRQAARIFLVGGMFALGFAVIVCRAIVFHVQENEKLERVALRQYRTAVEQSTRRGKILDAVGRPLAVNLRVESVFADPRKVADRRHTAAALARALNLPRDKLEARLGTQSKFVWIKRHITPQERAQVEQLNLPGVHFIPENQRYYPSGSLAANVLGAVGLDSEALGGVELAFNDVLISRAESGKYKRDARGQLYLSPTDAEPEVAEDLSAVTLTVDKTLQHIAETVLSDAVTSSNAKGGVAIVVDPHTGDVLAMAVVPSFDPNRYGDFSPAQWRNRAITDAYEPGSTFKIFTLAAALDAGVLRPEDRVDCENGRMPIANHVIRDSHPHGVLTVADVLKVSSNIGTAKAVKRLENRQLFEHLQQFGFGRKSGIALPGETRGIVANYRHWSSLDQATISFGQGVSASPLQVTMAMAAIANGGALMQPRIVQRAVDASGREKPVPSPTVVSRPLRPETARVMTRLLEAVTLSGGTGTLAASAEYAVAGKTGTAQKADPRTGGYAKGKYYSSFVGFAPADAPRVVALVAIDEPGGNLYYGGQVAAPAFRRIVESTLSYLKVPSTRQPEKAITASLPSKSENADGAKVSGPTRMQAVDSHHWMVPNFSGMTMRDVLAAIGQAPVKVEMSGSGIARQQTPAAGAVIPTGATCKIAFQPMM